MDYLDLNKNSPAHRGAVPAPLYFRINCRLASSAHMYPRYMWLSFFRPMLSLWLNGAFYLTQVSSLVAFTSKKVDMTAITEHTKLCPH